MRIGRDQERERTTKDRCRSASISSEQLRQKPSMDTLKRPCVSSPLVLHLLMLLLALGTAPQFASAQPMGTQAPKPMAEPSGPRAMPDAAPLTNFNPLCDSTLVHCLQIDSFAGHIYGHLQVLPKTERRDSAAIFPFGIMLGLFGRFAGGASTYYSFWNEGSTLYQQLGPLRLSLTGRLLPLFPLFSSDESGTDDDSHSESRHLQLGLTYEHEVRVGPFAGRNSLGLLTNLASLSIVGSKILGPFQLSATLGAFYDWTGNFATGSISGQFGWFLPGFEQLKVFVEGMGHGFPVYVKKDALPLISDGQDPIRPQGMVGGGIAFRTHKRLDLGVSVHRGFGDGIAPWSVSVNFLVLSVGRTYQGRAATPIAQLAADATVEVARAIHEYIQSLPIDPYLDERCMLLDENDEPLMEQPVGTRTADGRHCLVQGEKLPMHEHWLQDKKKSVICHDRDLTDCLMYRRPNGRGYRVLHRPWVGDDCVLRENVYDPSAPAKEPGQTHRAVELAVIGSLTKDKKGCTDQTGHVHAVGMRYYREHGHLWICDAPRIEEQRDHCFLALAELPQQMKNQVTPVGRIARKLDHGANRKAEAIDRIPGQIVDTAEDVAEGRVTLDTIKGALKAKAESIAKNATPEAAKQWLKGKIDGVKDWVSKPGIEKLEDAAEATGDAMIPDPVTAGTTLLTGGLGGGALRAAGGALKHEVEKDVVQAAERKAEKALAKKGRRAVGKADVAEHIAPAVPAAEGAVPKGGTYMLVDDETGKVMRTGRTNDLKRRRLEHARHPETKPYPMRVDKQTDHKPAQRGREQIIHDLHQPPLDKQNPISPKNPKRQQYLDAAKLLDEQKD